MNNITITIMFQMFARQQRVTVINSDGNSIEEFGFELNDLVNGIEALNKKYQPKEVILVGNKIFLQEYANRIQNNLTCFDNSNPIKIKIIER